MNLLYLCVFAALAINISATDEKCSYSRSQMVPTGIYENLKCVATFAADHCLEEYKNCPHIGRKENTCHYKGRIYEVGESIDPSDTVDVLVDACVCKTGSEFECLIPSDGCAEHWVGNYPSPGCYLRHDLNQLCGSEQICPPFNGLAECNVNGKIYKEGELFSHPTEHCSRCVCNKGFENKFEAPFCQPINCSYTLLHNNNKINEFCAPFYSKPVEDCCPSAWICPKNEDQYFDNPVPSPRDNPNLQCTFGNKKLALGDYLHQRDKNLGLVTCECIVPPFLYCRVYEEDHRTYD